MLSNYIKIALRNLRNNAVYSIINILGLSMGITCSLVIAIFIRYELNFDHDHQKADQIYRVVQETKFAEDAILEHHGLSVGRSYSKRFC